MWYSNNYSICDYLRSKYPIKWILIISCSWIRTYYPDKIIIPTCLLIQPLLQYWVTRSYDPRFCARNYSAREKNLQVWNFGPYGRSVNTHIDLRYCTGKCFGRVIIPVPFSMDVTLPKTTLGKWSTSMVQIGLVCHLKPT